MRLSDLRPMHRAGNVCLLSLFVHLLNLFVAFICRICLLDNDNGNDNDDDDNDLPA